MPKAPEFLHFGASRVPEPKPISTLSSRETRPPVLSNGLLSPWLGPGLWGWEMQLIPREVALIARRYYCGQYQKGWQTYWFQSRRWTQVTSPLHGLGFDLRSAGQEQLRLTCAVACRVHLRPLSPELSLSPQLGLMTPECTADWDATAGLRIVCSTCLYKRSNSLYVRIKGALCNLC